MSEWQPIETAPRDNEKIILIWDADDKFIYQGHLLEDDEISIWVTLEGFAIDKPTHWMPLPEPPK